MNTGNDYDTYYLAKFDLEKNDVYYSRLNSKLFNNISLINILGLNAEKNEVYASNIDSIEDVTGQNMYLYNNMLNTTDVNTVGSFINSTGVNSLVTDVIHPNTGNSIKAIQLNTGDQSEISSGNLALLNSKEYTLEFEYWSLIEDNSFSISLDSQTYNLSAKNIVQKFTATIPALNNDTISRLKFYKDINLPNLDSIFITNIKLYQNDKMRTRIYTKDGVKVNSIAEWILGKTAPDAIMSNTLAAGSNITISGIKFKDEEGDYTSINPNKGKNRRFNIRHIPGYYSNPDSEILGNNSWTLDADFNTFDGNPVLRTGDNLDITFNKAGKYIINLIEDDDIQNTSGVDFSKSSNMSNYEVYVHRAPKAVINYSEIDSTRVKLLNQSYDLDFYNRADKGIKGYVWEYKIVDYSENTIQDWQSIPDINDFSLNVLYKTYVRLTVNDFGALLSMDNDNELTDYAIKTFDNVGQPPVADFEIKVGTAINNSVPAMGYVYRGTQLTGGEILAETAQLDDSLIQWNDFFATSGTQSETWSVNQDVFNWRVRTEMGATTTLSVVNKFGLTDSATKSVDVKRVDLINNLDANGDGNTDIKFSGGTQQHFNIVLTSLDGELNWSNLDVRISSDDMKIYDVALENTISNVFEGDIGISYTDSDYCTYSVSIYSRRTGELLQTNIYSVEVINLKFQSLILSGYWNHWRGQVDVLGNTLTDDPHRFLSLEKIRIEIEALGDADYVEIDMSPELKAMTYTDPSGNVYRYTEFFANEFYFPIQIPVVDNNVVWEYSLPLTPSTIDWNNNYINSPYYITVTLVKGGRRVTYIATPGASEWEKLDNINITGNIYDLTYTQPN